jgi:hypothetical protein
VKRKNNNFFKTCICAYIDVVRMLITKDNLMQFKCKYAYTREAAPILSDIVYDCYLRCDANFIFKVEILFLKGSHVRE